jgi:hypothetical protein
MSKQFNIKGINGLYLSYKPEIPLTTLNYENQLIEDYDFFPSSRAQVVNSYRFKNARYQESSKIIGSNSRQKSNSIFKYTEITTNDELVANKMYYNTFKLYFKFSGSTLSQYILPTVPGATPAIKRALTKKVLDRLRIKVYVVIGSNEIPMEITNLEKYTTLWTPVVTGDRTGTINTGGYGIQLTEGLNSEDCVDMAYTGTTAINNLFNAHTNAPDGYNFRVDASFPDFDQIAKNTKTYKIKIKYLNIGVSGAGSTYSVSESVELMADTFVFYQQAQSSNLFSRKTEKQPVFDFMIKKEEFYINTNGTSVTESNKSYTTFNNGLFYILNKNNKSLYFNGVYFTRATMRKERGYPPNNLRVTLKNTNFSGNFMYENYTVSFRNKEIGELTISRLAIFQNNSNLLLNPFQSIELSATYKVLNLNNLDLQYYGKSRLNQDKKKGTIDFNFNIRCFANKELTQQINETLTFSVNLVNTGYVPIASQQQNNIIGGGS